MNVGELMSFICYMPKNMEVAYLDSSAPQHYRSLEIANLDLRVPSGVIPGHYPVSTRGTLIIDTRFK